MFRPVNTLMYSFFGYYSNMNKTKFKPRSFNETLTLLCRAKGGLLLKSNGEINQSEIARIAGVKQPNVSRWFKDSYAPHNDNVVKLAKAFRITPAQMRGEIPIDVIDGISAPSAEDETLLKQILELPDELKNMIREQVAVYKKLNEKN